MRHDLSEVNSNHDTVALPNQGQHREFLLLENDMAEKWIGLGLQLVEVDKLFHSILGFAVKLNHILHQQGDTLGSEGTLADKSDSRISVCCCTFQCLRVAKSWRQSLSVELLLSSVLSPR